MTAYHTTQSVIVELTLLRVRSLYLYEHLVLVWVYPVYTLVDFPIVARKTRIAIGPGLYHRYSDRCSCVHHVFYHHVLLHTLHHR